jgi:5-deoxy-glucuronate isomerase
MNLPPLDPRTCIVRRTDARKGRTITVSPATSAARYLHYGRIILDPGGACPGVHTGERETGFVCLKGRGTVTARSTHAANTAAATIAHAMSPYDALYLPRDYTFDVVAGQDGCDLAELSAPVTGRYPLQFASFTDVKKDPGLHFMTGGPGASREVNLVLAKNVQAGRIMAGVTFSQPGNWTSWPPHEHAAMLEEAYLYIDMPAPSFGIQLLYTNPHEPEVATIVREGDVVVMPKGYHPNVAAPGGSINFVWMMAAHREDADRQYGVVNVQPEFAALGSGLDKGRAR